MGQVTSLIKWFEIPAQDFDRAVNFYSTVFGLEIEINDFNGSPYGIFSTGTGSISGAIAKVSVENKEHAGPILYFYLPEGMNTTAEKILTCGGKIHQPKTPIKNLLGKEKTIISKIFNDHETGYCAVFFDSEGNKMALYSNS